MIDLLAQLRAVAASRRHADAGGKVADLLEAAVQRIEEQQQIIAAVRRYADARDGAERAVAWGDVEDVLGKDEGKRMKDERGATR